MLTRPPPKNISGEPREEERENNTSEGSPIDSKSVSDTVKRAFGWSKVSGRNDIDGSEVLGYFLLLVRKIFDRARKATGGYLTTKASCKCYMDGCW